MEIWQVITLNSARQNADQEVWCDFIQTDVTIIPGLWLLEVKVIISKHNVKEDFPIGSEVLPISENICYSI
jgi:hypothetical protein